MKSQQEIQLAHDLTVGILLNDMPNPFEDDMPLRYMADVLCWVLEHDHNTSFAKNLAVIKTSAEDAGFKIVNAGQPMTREEWEKRKENAQ